MGPWESGFEGFGNLVLSLRVLKKTKRGSIKKPSFRGFQKFGVVFEGLEIRIPSTSIEG